MKTKPADPIRFGITETFLKYVALITMIVDHLGLALSGHISNNAYEVMRIIGRLSFPLFCFCIVEGFLHTRSFWKYLLRIVICALLSEVPFDLLGYKCLLYWGHNNTLWTFTILLLVLFGIRQVRNRLPVTDSRYIIFTIIITAVGAVGAFYLHTDYSYVGILLGVVFYVFYEKKGVCFVLSAACLLLICAEQAMLGKHGIKVFREAAALPALGLIQLYDGRKSLIEKELPRFFFYALFPLHLLILGLYKFILNARI